MKRLTMVQINQSLKAVKEIIISKTNVSFAYFHGSSLLYQRGEQVILPRDLDVALYVVNGDPLMTELDIQMQFYNLTGFSPELLDLHSLNEAPLSIAIKIVTKGQLIFCRNDLFHSEYIEELACMYRQLEGFIERAYA